MMSVIENKNNQELEIHSHIYSIKEDLSKLRVDLARLETKIEKCKCEIIQWMFILYIIQTIAILALSYYS
jgi:hypothetical protein